MRRLLVLSGFFLLAFEPVALAWVGHARVGSRVFTIGSFCPLESIAGTLLGACILAGLGFGVSWLFRR